MAVHEAIVAGSRGEGRSFVIPTAPSLFWVSPSSSSSCERKGDLSRGTHRRALRTGNGDGAATLSSSLDLAMHTHGDTTLVPICGAITADEKRPEAAYTRIIAKLFEADPDAAMRALAYMMRRQITMPAALMNDGRDAGLFTHYAATTQQPGVYTASDYRGILEHLGGEREVRMESGEGRRRHNASARRQGGERRENGGGTRGVRRRCCARTRGEDVDHNMMLTWAAC